MNLFFFFVFINMNKKLLIDNFIWDKKEDKPYDVFYEHSPTTVLSLGWFKSNNELTEHGKKQIAILAENNKNEE